MLDPKPHVAARPSVRKGDVNVAAPGPRENVAVGRRELLRVRLDRLVPMEDQDLYDPCTAAEDHALVEDVRRRGLDHPIEVMPPTVVDGKEVYEIFDGNRRKAALLTQEILEADVLVRHDLAALAPAERRVAFVHANFMRRQLDMVQKVRAAVRAYEWRNASGRRLSGSQLHRARERIGEFIGVTGRTVSRYLRLARTPLPVQRAVSRGLLQLVVAERVADLPADKQAELAAAVAATDDRKRVRTIVREYFAAEAPDDAGRHGDDAGVHRASAHPRHRKANDAAAALARSLDRGLDDLEDRVPQVGSGVIAKNLATLKRAGEMIRAMVTLASRKSDPPA